MLEEITCVMVVNGDLLYLSTRRVIRTLLVWELLPGTKFRLKSNKQTYRYLQIILKLKRQSSW